ncbi:MAG: hypothetical protein L6Q57_02805 [Alphaproteobacteria bacterium]|nr:hypothetical protein [Alphaproteobacteria bacterium]
MKISACFAYAAGYGPKDHVFDRSKRLTAINPQQRILITLAMNLYRGDADFSNCLGKQGRALSLQQWITDHGTNYTTIAVQSVADLVVLSRRLIKSLADKERVHVLFAGAVLPYESFYLGPRPEKHRGLYQALKEGIEGLPIGQTRKVGLPRLIKFCPTQTTLDGKSASEMRGNFSQQGKDCYVSQLVIPPAAKAVNADQRVLDQVLDAGREGVYVLACPSVSIEPDNLRDQLTDPRKKLNWHHLRWIVQNSEAQICKRGISRIAVNTVSARSDIPPESSLGRHADQGMLFEKHAP